MNIIADKFNTTINGSVHWQSILCGSNMHEKNEGTVLKKNGIAMSMKNIAMKHG
jgi:hypothetical protein